MAQQPPTDLSANAKQFWRDMARTHELTTPDQFGILEIAARALDQADQAREIIARDGMLIATGAGSQKAHPLLVTLTSANTDFLRACRRLQAHGKTASRRKFHVMTFPPRGAA